MTTPAARKSDVARFRNTVRPLERPRLGFAEPERISDVLDTEPHGCNYLRGWYSRAKESIGLRRVKCGKWTCPNCIIDKLTDVFAPAWAFWEGVADRMEFANEDAWDNARRRKYDIRMIGPRATPGVVSMPGADGVSRVVWAPAGTFDGNGDTYRGNQLDDALLRDIRAMPLGSPGPSRAPNPDALNGSFQDNPPLIRAAALAAGFDIDISGRSYVVVGGCTPEQFRAFRRELRR